MKKELIIGGLAFASSFLGCFQVINLAHGRKWWAALGSCCIGVCQLSVYRLAPAVDGIVGTLCYVTGGLIGAQLSMLIKPAKRVPHYEPPTQIEILAEAIKRQADREAKAEPVKIIPTLREVVVTVWNQYAQLPFPLDDDLVARIKHDAYTTAALDRRIGEDERDTINGWVAHYYLRARGADSRTRVQEPTTWKGTVNTSTGIVTGVSSTGAVCSADMVKNTLEVTIPFVNSTLFHNCSGCGRPTLNLGVCDRCTPKRECPSCGCHTWVASRGCDSCGLENSIAGT